METIFRTDDVVSSTKSFRDLFLSEELCRALQASGFEAPSPVQEAALPVVLSGSDAIIQAKSGTGKTLIIACASMQHCHQHGGSHPQVLHLLDQRHSLQIFPVKGAVHTSVLTYDEPPYPFPCHISKHRQHFKHTTSCIRAMLAAGYCTRPDQRDRSSKQGCY
jgi:hypothetical protein